MNQYQIFLSDEERDGRVVRACDVKFDKDPDIYDWNLHSKLSNALDDWTYDTAKKLRQHWFSREQSG